MELRSCNEEIREATDNQKKEEGMMELAAAVKTMYMLCGVARREGLLSLENKAMELEEVQSCSYLKSMIMLIVDGTDPDLVEGACLAKYFARGMRGFEGITYLIYLVGILGIQASDNPRIIEEKLLAFIPDEAEELYRKEEEKSVTDEKEADKQDEIDLSMVEKYYEGDIFIEPEDNRFFLIKVTDHIFRTLDDSGIQRVLKEIDDQTLSLAMKGLSGEARHSIFKNLSRRQSVVIAEEMDYLGPVRVNDVSDSVYEVFLTIIKLVDHAELRLEDGAILEGFKDLFEVQKESKKKEEKAENELYMIFREMTK